MKIITLRNLSPALARALRRKADETRSSVSKTVINLLEDTVGLARPHKGKRVHHDLDHLAGAWSKEEAAAFGRALKAQRTIDVELWK